MSGPHRFNVAAGSFFFKYRNGIFPVVFAAFMLGMRPQILFGSHRLDRLFMMSGYFVALSGELARLATIGFEYIERGGRKGQVYASALVRKGLYGLTRNPIYVGNFLIVTGVVMVSGAPLAYLTVIPFFYFVYQAIISAEEDFLRKRFGRPYEDYCAEVPRLLPSFHGLRESFSGVRFNGRRPFRQDLSTIAWVAAVLAALPCWRSYFLNGWALTKTLFYATVEVELAGLALYCFFVFLKKRKSPLFYTKDQRVSPPINVFPGQ